jgi:hypothetical protein
MFECLFPENTRLAGISIRGAFLTLSYRGLVNERSNTSSCIAPNFEPVRQISWPHMLCDLHGASTNSTTTAPTIETTHGHLQFEKPLTPAELHCFLSTKRPYLEFNSLERMTSEYRNYYAQNEHILQLEHKECTLAVQYYKNIISELPGHLTTAAVHSAALTFIFETIERILLYGTKLSEGRIQMILRILQLLLLAATSATWTPVALGVTTTALVSLFPFTDSTATFLSGAANFALHLFETCGDCFTAATSLGAAITSSFTMQGVMLCLCGSKKQIRTPPPALPNTRKHPYTRSRARPTY